MTEDCPKHIGQGEQGYVCTWGGAGLALGGTAASGPPAVRVGISQPFCIIEKVPCPALRLLSLTLQNDGSDQLPGMKWDSLCLGQETETQQDLFSLALTEGFPEQSWIPGLREGQGMAEKNMDCRQQP